MKRSNPFLYIPLAGLLKVFAIIKGQRFKNRLNIKGPAIVLSNHTSFYDFIYTTAALYPKRVTYLAASKMFYETQTKYFLKLARAVPKSLMQADPVASLKAFRVLKKNGIVSVFPEGQISPSGKTLKPSFSIAKFLKKAAVDVYIVKHEGAGIVNPPWNKKTYPGLIKTSYHHLCTPDELQKLSLDDIYNKVYDALYFEPSTYLNNSHHIYKDQSIEGLEHVIYECPSCLKEGLVSKNQQLVCPSCGMTLTYHSGLLEQKGVDLWFKEQETRLRKIIDQMEEYKISSSVELQSFRKGKLITVGYGELTLDREKYTYQGTIDGIAQELHFHVKDIPTLPSDIGRNIQIYQHNQIYQFEMKNPFLPTKFVHVAEYLHEKSLFDVR
ncbi:MAG TPA: lysophospholipid acyltransferase family protein [Acholeplasmataceae bacterium]|jgi:1-acyl-sn-glycerol-3-phosphate acyltransferase|nr:lysophospholipid acyltransferase family protein [Acholeplasmataceae bacterium]HRX44424.1 lysophospholipid acyltransferase family protein [Acholeplasmataceae bacterium]